MHPWYGCAPLYHTSAEEARLLRRYLLEKMEGVVEDLRFFDQERDPEMVEGSLFLGTPTEDNIKSTYWRKREEPPEQMDPDRDRCGVLWMCHTIPMRGEAVGHFAALAEEIVLSHGLEPNLGIACSSARAARTFVALMYDREVEGEDAKAMRCHDAIFSALTQAGFLSYRLGLSSMQQMPPCLDATPALLSQIKQMLDPEDLLAPGRYRF
jgi:4-cresol dehydrogenase (hydroxylating)